MYWWRLNFSNIKDIPFGLDADIFLFLHVRYHLLPRLQPRLDKERSFCCEKKHKTLPSLLHNINPLVLLTKLMALICRGNKAWFDSQSSIKIRTFAFCRESWPSLHNLVLLSFFFHKKIRGFSTPKTRCLNFKRVNPMFGRWIYSKERQSSYVHYRQATVQWNITERF